jgi:predicted phosphoribosyltransferase
MAGPDPFPDRTQAGRVLGRGGRRVPAADRVRRTAVGRGAARGGVPVGLEVARAVDGDLDVVVARKIGLPWQPELGVGAVTADGPPILDRRLLALVRLPEHQVQPLIERERAEVHRRLRGYRGDRPAPPVAGRVVIVVDDGLATGVTARAALASVRAQEPDRLVFAAPVCAAESAQVLQREADAVICVHAPTRFGAVGQWYDFAQLDDDRGVRPLNQTWNTTPTR